MIGKTLAHYRVVEKIGAGGMGEVCRATDTKLGRDVALKILPAEMASDPARRSRFGREAQALAALNHPNIVTIYSIEEAGSVHFLTMELVAGKSLDELIPPAGLELGRFLCPALLDAVYQGLGDEEKRLSIAAKTVELIEKHLELNPDDVRAVYFGAGSLVLIGRVAEGLEWAQRALEAGPDDDPSVLYNVACVYAKVGDAETALDLLDRVVLENKANKLWMENDHDMDPLRDHPRFRKLMGSLE